jgi:hypothetical protein
VDVELPSVNPQAAVVNEGFNNHRRLKHLSLEGLPSLWEAQRIAVDADLEQATLSVNWGDPQNPVEIVLRDSAGVLVQGSYPGVVIRTSDTHRVYKFARPKSGLWSIQIFAQKQPVPVVASLDGVSVTTLDAFTLTENTKAKLDQPVIVGAVLSDSQPVLNATIAGIARSITGVSYMVVLNDSATGNDQVANDGFYTGEFTPPSGGIWNVELIAEAINNGNNPISRVATTSVKVPYRDQDRDGMPDRWEFANGLNIKLDDSRPDPDGDGARNLQEWYFSSDPNNPDTDGGGVKDGVEQRLFADVHWPEDDASLLVDTDGDRIPDRWEDYAKTNQNVGDANNDTDNDGNTNFEEWLAGTDPHNPDSDGDGWSDGAEAGQNSDPLDANDHDPRPDAKTPPASDDDLVQQIRKYWYVVLCLLILMLIVGIVAIVLLRRP